MNDLLLRDLLVTWQFWALELLFICVVVSTIVEARRLPLERRTLRAAWALGAFAWLLTATVPPRTNRIFYDEQIYQSVGRNLSDLHLAQMCNDGNVEYGRLQCFRGEYNKEPYGYPYLLSILYRVAGVHDAAAFRFNNVVAGLSVVVAVVLADLLFGDFAVSVLSGLLLALTPMQLTWSATAASEPAAALFCAASALAAVHFARGRTSSALAWTMVLSAFAATLRPECLLVFPIVVAAIVLLAPGEFRTARLWRGAAAWLLVASVAIVHAVAVRNNPWDAGSAATVAWRYLPANLPANFWFYVRDERFPALAGVAAAIGLMSWGSVGPAKAGPHVGPASAGRTDRGVRERAFLLVYFLAFWAVFLFFYAGSYNWGANVRYSLMSYVPLAILAAAGLARAGRFILRHARAGWTEREVLASIAAVVVVQSLWYLPLVRATGEEAWAARADVASAQAFVRSLPPNSIVLTHNPGMFHVWNVSAAQLSIATDTPEHVDQLFPRYAGGVYVHWNFWCNVQDRVQNAFCTTALDRFPHDKVDSRREREYEYALYRLRPRHGV